MAIKKSFYIISFVTLTLATSTLAATLYPYYYDKSCPHVLPIIKKVVEDAIVQHSRMGASLFRLHFHDCFANDQTSTIDSEENQLPTRSSACGFNVIDKIKSEVDKVCGRPIVSCADILVVAAHDSVVIVSQHAFF